MTDLESPILSNEITVVTPVYINSPIRWDYFVQSIESFYRCCLFEGPIMHKLIDDRSPLYGHQIKKYCSEKGIEYLGRVEESTRRSFFADIYMRLLESIETEFFIYLEPDHYWYLPYDFVSPIIRLYKKLPELYQIYLRAPLVYEQPIVTQDCLITADGTHLFPVPLDNHNCGWVGKGRGHESFSLMPSMFQTAKLRCYLAGRDIPGSVMHLENTLEREWRYRRLTGYLNSQAFCYHIGKKGGTAFGNALEIGDQRYEKIWSNKILGLTSSRSENRIAQWARVVAKETKIKLHFVKLDILYRLKSKFLQ